MNILITQISFSWHAWHKNKNFDGATCTINKVHIYLYHLDVSQTKKFSELSLLRLSSIRQSTIFLNQKKRWRYGTALQQPPLKWKEFQNNST